MWVLWTVLGCIAIVVVNNWTFINVMVHRYRFPDLGPQATVDKLLKEVNGYLSNEDDLVYCRDCDGKVPGTKSAMITAIVKQEGL